MNLAIRCLETILDYNMTAHEAKSYKILCIYIESVKRIFPDFFIRYPKGDPRKSYLFKVCYKLAGDTTHPITDSDYPLYVIAQLDIIRRNTEAHGKDAHISPACIVGEKAWARWCVWKKIYDKTLERKADTAAEAGVDPNRYELVIAQLRQDKTFLVSKIPELTAESVTQAIEGRAMLRWVATKQISPYYAIMSLVLNKWLKEHNLTLDSMFNLDFELYRPAITPEVQSFYHANFPYEI
jgi:hypothetical protein